MRSEAFLQKYRILEGLLEKRYEGRKMSSSSVVMEYLRDGDSEPVRVDLDLMREIRNILSHNAGSTGEAVVEPSPETLSRLEEIIAYVRRSRCAAEFGTPASRIFSAHMNDRIAHVVRTMYKNGYSHVPIAERGGIVGVLSIRSVFDYLAENGLASLDDDSRVSQLGELVRLEKHLGVRYLFVRAGESIVSVRSAFEKYSHKNNRLSAVFVTENGAPDEPLICMLTPWDVLSDHAPRKESPQDGNGKKQEN